MNLKINVELVGVSTSGPGAPQPAPVTGNNRHDAQIHPAPAISMTRRSALPFLMSSKACVVRTDVTLHEVKYNVGTMVNIPQAIN
ncbi:hypothetical protein [Dyella sp.]|uniref:hypothetical protein n=1 Tax=Dyella sp. TaxID=1869338 RepID=UPI00284149FE|nr:hypothetical protein [Dyella sp.]MDR3443710.1 hypothetical protein [Dyella sp.]